MGYVPAEIESAVKDGLVLAYNDESAESLEMSHIITALQDMVPMSKSHKENIDRILAWARDNATSVEFPAKALVDVPPASRVIRPRSSRG